MTEFAKKNGAGCPTDKPTVRLDSQIPTNFHSRPAIHHEVLPAQKDLTPSQIGLLRKLSPDRCREILKDCGYTFLTSSETGLSVFNPKSKRNEVIFSAKELQDRKDAVLEKIVNKESNSTKRCEVKRLSY